MSKQLSNLVNSQLLLRWHHHQHICAYWRDRHSNIVKWHETSYCNISAIKYSAHRKHQARRNV